MSKRKLNFGMIGGGLTGFIGNVHRHGATFDDLAILKAGCFSRNPSKNSETADVWGIAPERIYNNFSEMAEKEVSMENSIDFVTIATPNNTHYQIAKVFLCKGVHVMSDKPVAMNVKQGAELEQIAKANSLLYGVSYTYAGYSMIRQARELIDNGKIGKIINIVAEYPQDWISNTFATGKEQHGSWRFDPGIIGSSLATADIGTHLEHLIYAMTGLKLEKVLASFEHIPQELPLETNVQILLKYEGNIPGMMWASQVAIGHECSVSVRIFGEKGAIEWNHDNPTQLKVTYVNQPVQIYTCDRDFLYPSSRNMSRLPYGHPEGFYEAFANIYREFCKNLLQVKYGGEPAGAYYYPTITDGVRGLKFVEACILSNKQGNVWIDVK